MCNHRFLFHFLLQSEADGSSYVYQAQYGPVYEQGCCDIHEF